MSVQSEITRIRNNIQNSHTAVISKSGSYVEPPNSENLPAAIATIPMGTIASNLEISFTAEYIPANEE